MKLNRILHNKLFIVVFSFTVDSLCYHTITNTGFKVAEAVNFATGDCFVKKKKLSACLCGDTHVRFSASTRIRMHNYATSEKNKLLFSPATKADERKTTTSKKKSSIPPDTIVRCDICQKNLRMDNLRRHIKSIHKKTEIKCPKKNCIKKYSRKCNLTRHLITFHKKKDGTTSCPTCHKSYSDIWELRKHQKNICTSQN